MKNILKKTAAVMVLAGFCVLLVPSRAFGASAVKVKSTVNVIQKGDQIYQSMTVKGVTTKGKKVWTYQTPSFRMGQIPVVKCKAYKKRVYIFQGGTVKVLKLSSGKKIWSRKTKVRGGHVCTMDKSENLYMIGYFENTAYKIDKRGKKKWSKNLSYTGNYWAYKMIYKKDVITVKYEALDSGTGSRYVKLKSKTGAVISYQ